MGFCIQNIKKMETLGEFLKLTRKNQHISLAQMEEKTKIQMVYLQALESNDFQSLPELFSVECFLKIYARVLGIDAHYLLSRYKQERTVCFLKNTVSFTRQKIKNKKMCSLYILARWGSLVLVSSFVLFFAAHQIYNLLQPPSLILFEPNDGFTTQQTFLTVSGKTEQETAIFVNQIPVRANNEGIFSINLVLEEGTNIITVEGTKRYSKPTVIQRHVIFQTDRFSQKELSTQQTSLFYPQ